MNHYCLFILHEAPLIEVIGISKSFDHVTPVSWPQLLSLFCSADTGDMVDKITSQYAVAVHFIWMIHSQGQLFLQKTY